MKYHILLIFSIFTSSLLAQSSWSSLDNAPVNANGTRFDDVFFINSDLGWIANGANGNVFKTIDGGENWTEVLNEADISANVYYRNIEFFNENICQNQTPCHALVISKNQMGFMGVMLVSSSLCS